MDKEQTRILILVLAGILFFGQGIYDYFKKRRRQSPGNRRAAGNVRKPQPSRSQQHTVTVSLPRTMSVSSAPAPLFPADPENDKPVADKPAENCDIPVSADETPEISESPQYSADIANEELRRAVIWSEILKRKS